MRSRASTRFWRLFKQLRPEIQRLAIKNYQLWKANHWHASLHFKKVKEYWVARIGDNYRALGIETDGMIIWLWIGPHDDYERLIRG